MNSIRLRLLKWLIVPILLINLAGGALTYMLAWLPAQLAFDQGLSGAAAALGARLSADGGQLRIDLPRQAEQVLRSDDTDAVYFVVRDAAGRTIAGDADFPALPRAAADGATSDYKPAAAFDSSLRDEAVRGVVLRLSLPVASGAPVQAAIGVAKTLRKRNQVRLAVVRALVLLESLFALTCVGLIWFSVGNGLLPLNRLRAGLNARDGDDLEPIAAAQVPYELEPVVSAFNGLLDKVSQGAHARQEFLANVAHQLRTPLAGLKTQLEWLGARHAEPETAHSLKLMLSATERMIRKTNQLLALARAEPGHFEKTRLEPVALDALVEVAIQSFVDQATLKAIDLGFDLQPVTIVGDRFLLRDLIDNLIDNAIRYTPPRGTVTVACRPDGEGGWLSVEDNGPGIPLARREQVFSRYVRLDDRTTGSGLGLAIVRDIATVHGASLTVAEGAGGRGALFSVHFR
ncbi:sensor histidine kinase [Duganella rhizosphaerae]|uniref:sensor histidine kinase n=1 Tax=Duganella rhizosphaerae TaxID=2885763 RepID=UPI0030E80916